MVSPYSNLVPGVKIFARPPVLKFGYIPRVMNRFITWEIPHIIILFMKIVQDRSATVEVYVVEEKYTGVCFRTDFLKIRSADSQQLDPETKSKYEVIRARGHFHIRGVFLYKENTADVDD